VSDQSLSVHRPSFFSFSAMNWG